MDIIIPLHDIILINLLSFLCGSLTGLGIYHKICIKDINHDNPREIGTTYPFSPPIIPTQPSAPPPFNLNSEPIIEAQPTSSSSGNTEIVIRNHNNK